MSGIAGIVRFNGDAVAPGLIESMTSAMDYRGPDGTRHWQTTGCALGHCLLQTTPESLQEQQPVVSADAAVVLVMDGRLDNFSQLRTQLLASGCMLRNQSDPELLLHAYLTWGTDCVRHIEGDFAFAIWNERDGCLFCARDALGNRPFHYFWSGHSLIFASDLHAILELDEVPREANEGVLAEYLASQWYARDETLWRGILRLPASHCMVVEGTSPRARQYWSPDLFATLDYTNDEDYIEHYRDLLFESVRRLSRSHRPLACEVSGGLDSSALFSVAEQLRRGDELMAPDLAGYSMNFEGDPHADEIAYCRAVAAHLNRPIAEVTPSLPELDWYRARAQRYKQFPGLPNGVMAGNLNQIATEQGCRVIFNGLGGDEWLGAGRRYYLDELAAGNWRRFAHLFRQDIQHAGLLRSVWWVLRQGLPLTLPDSAKEGIWRLLDRLGRVPDTRNWLSASLRSALERQKQSHRTPMSRLRWPGQRNEIAVLESPFAILAHEHHELFAAGFGIEIRRPFYTTAMVQFSFSVPKRLLFASGQDRYCHRRAMAGLLPETVLKRGDKAEFSTTYRQLPTLGKLLTQEIPARRRGWLQQESVQTAFERYVVDKGESMDVSTLWMLIACDLVFDE